MKKLSLLITLVTIIFSCSPVKNADRLAQKNQKVSLYPEVAFDKELAKSQLATGRSTIRGVVYKSTNKMSVVNAKAYGSYAKVNLFPVNDYLMAWYNLREQKEDKNTSVYFSEEANTYRIEVTADEYGRFEFKDLKPGKYFIHSIMSVTKSGYSDVNVGSNSYGTQYYQKQRYSNTKYHRNEEFVEITKDGEIIEVKLN